MPGPRERTPATGYFSRKDGNCQAQGPDLAELDAPNDDSWFYEAELKRVRY